MSAAIELQNVAIQFSQEPLLTNVNVEIADQETFVIIGPSGEGKSVLLKLMAGVLSPSSGQILIEGQHLPSLSTKERRKYLYKMGMLFQKNALFDSLTCGENIAFPLREVTDLTESEIQDKIDFYLSEVDIPHAKNLFPDEISGGMQKRLGIARALALDPKIIFYDDPTAGLDPITSRKIIDLILNLKEQNKSTVVAITNDMARAYQMAHRMGMVVDGGLEVLGSVDETKSCTDPRVQQFIQGQLTGPLTEDQ